jgi:transposase
MTMTAANGVVSATSRAAAAGSVNALYMPCLGAATQSNPVLKAFYDRLIAKGKEPNVAVIACMRKLIVILNTMIARGEKWDPSRYAVQ